MAVLLKGGCRVTDMREGECLTIGTLSMWRQIGRAHGAFAISLRILEFAPGVSPAICNETSDEVLYFLERPEEEQKQATIFIDGQPYEVSPQSGIYLQPNQMLTVENRGRQPIVFISSQCPEPDSETMSCESQSMSRADSSRLNPVPIVRLTDRPAIPTADRWYRVLVDDEVGSTQITQFIGSRPPGRAPDHFHTYEEVLFILRGEGRMWADESSTNIGSGSCIYLPRKQVHCVENTGTGELRLLGVFYPAGSPSVRYDA
jgi:mannose-6-phosphate isomerase-like protein (cupin superfamily)